MKTEIVGRGERNGELAAAAVDDEQIRQLPIRGVGACARRRISATRAGLGVSVTRARSEFSEIIRITRIFWKIIVEGRIFVGAWLERGVGRDAEGWDAV